MIGRSDLFFINCILALLIVYVSASKYKEKSCLVCKQIMKEIVMDIEKENPKKKIQVGNFRLDADGSQKQKVITYAGSEIHLTEMFEEICDRMDEYAQARHKETGQFALLNLAKQMGEIQNYHLIQDPDLNRSLKFYCQTIIEDYEDAIMKFFVNSSSFTSEEATEKICWKQSGFCSNDVSEPDEDEVYFRNEF